MLRADRCFVGLLLMAFGWVSPGLAQDNHSATAALRSQIEALQSQLTSVERADEKSRKVAQIGAARTSAGRPLPLVVRLYDMSDLFTVAPEYPAIRPNAWSTHAEPLFAHSAANQLRGASGAMGGMGGGMFRVGDNGAAAVRLPAPRAGSLAQVRVASDNANQNGSAGTSLDGLINAVTNTIEPDSWDQNGGRGTISALGTSLLISAEEPIHDQIEQLISLFRQRWGSLRTVTVRAYWLWLSDGQLRDLVGEHGSAAGRNVPAYGDVDDERLADAIEAANADERPGYRAVLTCYNGQTVNTTSGRQRLAVSQISNERTERDEANSAARQTITPTAVTVFDGISLQVTPVVTYGGQVVVLDLQCQVSRPISEDAPAGGEETAARLDRSVVTTQQMATTSRLPVDRTVLVGGMTFAAGTDAGPGLYLFVKAQVQELRDDREAATTLEPPTAPSDLPPGEEEAAAGESPAAKF